MKRPAMIMDVWQTTPGVKQSQPPLYHPATFTTSVQPLLTQHPNGCLSPSFHYSHLTGPRIRVPPSPTSLSLNIRLSPTHFSQFTGQYMEGDTGPVQSLVPSAISALQRAVASLLSLGFPLQHNQFLHLLCSLLRRPFHFLIRHSGFSIVSFYP